MSALSLYYITHAPYSLLWANKNTVFQVVLFTVKKNKLISFLETFPLQGAQRLAQCDLTSAPAKILWLTFALWGSTVFYKGCMLN